MPQSVGAGMNGVSAAEMHLSDGDQRHDSRSNRAGPDALEAGNQSSHKITDRMDQYSVGDRANKEKKEEKEEKHKAAVAQGRPTATAEMHGNKPSRGAVVDDELQRDDEQRLREKEESKKAKSGH